MLAMCVSVGGSPVAFCRPPDRLTEPNLRHSVPSPGSRLTAVLYLEASVGPRRRRKQEIAKVTQPAVEALARNCFQAGCVANEQASMRAPDQGPFVKAAERGGHSCALHSQHLRQKLMRDLQFGTAAPAADQQPSRQSLLEGVQAVAGGHLRNDSQAKGNITLQNSLQVRRA